MDHLRENTGSTAVYVGKLEAPKKKIGEEDDDKAHIDDEAQKIIHFLNSTTDHGFMVD